MAELIKNIEKETVFKLAEQVKLEGGKVNSLTLAQTPATKITVFAIDADEGMSSHAAPGDALIAVLEGTGEITVNGVPHQLGAGESIVMPAGARTRCVASPRSKCYSWWYWLRKTVDGERKGGATTLDEMEKAYFEPNAKGGGSKLGPPPFFVRQSMKLNGLNCKEIYR
ncbi:MAG: cupin domain-containing protein [Collinsella sp.]